jgi:hypothetical protein
VPEIFEGLTNLQLRTMPTERAIQNAITQTEEFHHRAILNCRGISTGGGGITVAAFISPSSTCMSIASHLTENSHTFATKVDWIRDLIDAIKLFWMMDIRVNNISEDKSRKTQSQHLTIQSS